MRTESDQELNPWQRQRNLQLRFVRQGVGDTCLLCVVGRRPALLRQSECRGGVGQEGREEVRNLVVVVSVLSGRAMLVSHVLKETFWLLWVGVEVPVQGHYLSVPAALPGTLPGPDWWSIRCSLGE